MPGMKYTLLYAGEAQIGGVAELPENARKMGAPPHWLGYVGADDVDATAARITALGGKIYMQPMDIPNVGRFAVAADPQGATFAIFKSAHPQPGGTPAMAPGHVGWHELYAADGGTAFGFYADLFGWARGDAMDMGPQMGTYQLFKARGDQDVGGVMTKPPMVPVPCWLYYFNVGNIDEAAGRVKAAGGQVVNGPMEVPGGGWILQAMDPQGAMFALFGTR
jgi:hypothetical protein